MVASGIEWQVTADMSTFSPAPGTLTLSWQGEKPIRADRVSVLLDSPGVPLDWGGDNHRPMRVLVVPICRVPAVGEGAELLDYESWSAFTIARLTQERDAALVDARTAQFQMQEMQKEMQMLRSRVTDLEAQAYEDLLDHPT